MIRSWTGLCCLSIRSWMEEECSFCRTDTCDSFPAGSQPPVPPLFEQTVCFCAVFAGWTSTSTCGAAGASVPDVPLCQTMGEGPDSVLCAPVDKLSHCQRGGSLLQEINHQLQQPCLTLGTSWEDSIYSNTEPSLVVLVLRYFPVFRRSASLCCRNKCGCSVKMFFSYFLFFFLKLKSESVRLKVHSAAAVCVIVHLKLHWIMKITGYDEELQNFY